MWRSAVVATFLAASAGVLVSGCAATCGANPQKLDLLPTVEWNGPDSIFFKRTQIDFLYGKLLSYTTENRGAL